MATRPRGRAVGAANRRPAGRARTLPRVSAAPPIDVAETDRRAAAGWAARCARRVLGLFESAAPEEARPRAAVVGAQAYARGTRERAPLRPLLWAALAAARAVRDPAAIAAARAAACAAAAPFLHARAMPDQVKHLLSSAAYAALARAAAPRARHDAAERELAWAIAHAPPAVRALVLRLPPLTARPVGPRGRPGLGARLSALDAALRSPTAIAPAPSTSRHRARSPAA